MEKRLPLLSMSLLLALLLLAGWVGCRPALAVTPAGLQGAIAEGWEYRWGGQVETARSEGSEWQLLGALREPPGRRGRAELWLRCRLPVEAWQDQVLFIHEIDQVCDVFAGSELIQQIGSHEDGRRLQSPGWRWQMIPVPDRAAGQYLTLHVFSKDIGYIGPYEHVSVGTPAEHLIRMIRRDLDRIVIATLSAFIGLLSLAVYFGKKHPRKYVYFAIFALMAGGYIFCRTEIKYLLFDNGPFWTRLEIATLASLPILLMLHLRNILHVRFERLFTVVAAFFCVGTAIAFLLDAFHVVPVVNLFQLLLLELIAASLLTLVSAAWSTVDGMAEAKVMALGVLVAAIITVVSTLASLKILPVGFNRGHWGILVVVLTLGVILLRRFVQTYHEVEGNLKERDARLTAIIGALPDSFVLMQRDGTILDSHLWQPDAALLLPGGLRDSIQASFPVGVADPILAALHGMGPTDAVSVTEGAVINGTDRATFEARIVPVQGDRCLTLLRNVTERKKIDRMSREFVSMVSHELRTPLTVIKGTLDLLAGMGMSSLPPKLATLVSNARENANRLGMLINDLLDSQRIEAGVFGINPAMAEIGAVMRRAVALNRPFAERRSVSLSLVDPLPDVSLWVDVDRLIQALTNLISNAVKFSDPGDPVRISAELLENSVRFAVEDRGPGIPEEFHGRLFQKFSQADSSDRRSVGGSGLGLSITKAIIDLHGGTIDFSTVEGLGTRFYFDLPLPASPELGSVPPAAHSC